MHSIQSGSVTWNYVGCYQQQNSPYLLFSLNPVYDMSFTVTCSDTETSQGAQTLWVRGDCWNVRVVCLLATYLLCALHFQTRALLLSWNTPTFFFFFFFSIFSGWNLLKGQSRSRERKRVSKAGQIQLVSFSLQIGNDKDFLKPSD